MSSKQPYLIQWLNDATRQAIFKAAFQVVTVTAEGSTAVQDVTLIGQLVLKRSNSGRSRLWQSAAVTGLRKQTK